MPRSSDMATRKKNEGDSKQGVLNKIGPVGNEILVKVLVGLVSALAGALALLAWQSVNFKLDQATQDSIAAKLAGDSNFVESVRSKMKSQRLVFEKVSTLRGTFDRAGIIFFVSRGTGNFEVKLGGSNGNTPFDRQTVHDGQTGVLPVKEGYHYEASGSGSLYFIKLDQEE